MFRAASGHKVGHEGIRTNERSTQFGFTRRLTVFSDCSAEDLVGCVSTRTGHELQFTSPGDALCMHETAARSQCIGRAESTQSSSG